MILGVTVRSRLAAAVTDGASQGHSNDYALNLEGGLIPSGSISRWALVGEPNLLQR